LPLRSAYNELEHTQTFISYFTPLSSIAYSEGIKYSGLQSGLSSVRQLSVRYAVVTSEIKLKQN